MAYFIATLGTMSILRGLIYVYTEGIPLYGLKYPEIKVWGQGYIGMIPVPIILTVIIFAVSAYLFYKTKFGRYTVSIGSNEEAAKLVEEGGYDYFHEARQRSLQQEMPMKWMRLQQLLSAEPVCPVEKEICLELLWEQS